MDRIKPKSEFARHALVLMTGTTIAQAIPIAISPILTRIYTPDDFGVFALYLAISSIIGVIATGRYELAILLPHKDSDAANIAVLSMSIACAVSVLAFLLVVLFHDVILLGLGNPQLGVWLYVAPFAIFLTGIYQSLNFWNNREKKYKTMAYSRVLQNGATGVMNVGIGSAGFGAAGLVFGGVAGQFLSSAYLARAVWLNDRKLFKNTRWLKQVALAKKYIAFPKVNLLHSFLDEGKNLVAAMTWSKIFSIVILGQFYMVNKILLLPSSLIGGSVSQVLFSEIAIKHRAKIDFSGDVLRLMMKLFACASVPFLIIELFGPDLFAQVFGEPWRISGELARYYALYILFHFVAAPISVIPLVLNKQVAAFWWNFTGVFIYVGCVAIGSFFFSGLESVLLLISMAMAVYFSCFCFWIYRISSPEKPACVFPN